jgi:hypothetical protein
MAIGVVATIILGVAALLYYRGKIPQPAAILMVQSTEDFSGAIVTVDSALTEPVTRTITAENKYSCRFTVPPGIYSVRIEHQGQLVHQVLRMRIDEYRYYTLTFPNPDDKHAEKH